MQGLRQAGQNLNRIHPAKLWKYLSWSYCICVLVSFRAHLVIRIYQNVQYGMTCDVSHACVFDQISVANVAPEGLRGTN